MTVVPDAREGTPPALLRHHSGTPSTVHTVSAAAAAAMHHHGCTFVDCRPANLHAIERITGAICFPGHPAIAPTLPRRQDTIVVYDSGSISPSDSYSRAGAAIHTMLATAPQDTRFCLLAGGLPAVRRDAPALLDSSLAAHPDVMRKMREKLQTSGRPNWATDALECLAQSAAPAAQILPWLYLGSAADACKLDRLERFGVTHILVVAKELKPMFASRYTYRHFAAEDTAEYPLASHFDEAIAFLQDIKARYDAGEKVCVLVHCYAGLSRSVATVIAYLVASHGYCVQGALQMVKARRQGASPDNFFPQLAEFEMKRLVACPSDAEAR